MNTLRLFIAGIVTAFLMTFLSCSALSAKKPVFKHSIWVNKQEMFVADAGTMTITNTLTFGSGKSVKVGWDSYLPAHAAMYMNRDGSVDRIPASSSEYVHEGTWQFKKGILTIKLEDGSEKVFEYRDGALIGGKDFDGSDLVYTRQ